MKIHYYFILILCLVLGSCNNETGTLPVGNDIDIDTNFVDIREAISFATLLEYDIYSSRTLSKSTSSLEVESIKPIGSGYKPSYYIINYKNNSGFVIIAADKRADALLAFSTENNFNYDAQELPQGLVEWMINTDGYIKNIRDSLIQEPIQTRRQLCNALKTTRSTISPPRDDCFEFDGTNCPPEYQKSRAVGPLLKTSWHQESGFNNLLPKCNSGNVKAGCVAIAMAQVMYYHQYPKFYDWSSMDINYGGYEASRLIRDLGRSDALNMDYGCESSSTDTKNAVRVFRNNFNYSSALFGEFNPDIVENQLDMGLPVILRGKKGSSWSFLGIHGSGHAWVCDGYISSNVCTHSSLHFHMNWGWGDFGYNGWFGYGDWRAPNGNNYNKNNDMVYNIRP